MSRQRVYNGNELISLAALDAGCRFYAGYPITPSSEIMEVMSKEMPKVGGGFIQMEDEIASIGAAIGAAWTGAKSMTASSGPGISLKAEHIGFACITETPLVIVNIMRGGPSTGFPTATSQSDLMQARWGTHGDHPAIALIPGTAHEMYYETIRAFNLAEQFRTPVIILGDEMLGHLNTMLDLPDPATLDLVERKLAQPKPGEKYRPFAMDQGDVPPMGAYFRGYRFHLTGLNSNEYGYPTIDPDMIQAQQERMMNKVANHTDEILKNDTFNLENADILTVAVGSTGSAVKQASKDMKAEGSGNLGVFRPITLWPFPEKDLDALIGSGKYKGLFVPEANLGQLVLEVERINRGRLPIQTLQKVNGFPVTPGDIVERVKEVF
ncbi:MAG: 2-oxoacid:acceptor oxidoreductase subunit alpha [Acidobacteria bacterium]|nr:2-oxoacid:acceptor oxidoreductase subunit alpha [Acidobacteriota bacterium]